MGASTSQRRGEGGGTSSAIPRMMMAIFDSFSPVHVPFLHSKHPLPPLIFSKTFVFLSSVFLAVIFKGQLIWSTFCRPFAHLPKSSADLFPRLMLIRPLDQIVSEQSGHHPSILGPFWQCQYFLEKSLILFPTSLTVMLAFFPFVLIFPLLQKLEKWQFRGSYLRLREICPILGELPRLFPPFFGEFL